MSTTCTTLYFVRFHFDFSICRQVPTYLSVYVCIYSFFFCIHYHLFIDRLLCVLYIFKHVPCCKWIAEWCTRRHAERVTERKKRVHEQVCTTWNKRNEWWQSETFTITVDYNCRLKFLLVLNCVPVAKEHFHTKSNKASGLSRSPFSCIFTLHILCHYMQRNFDRRHGFLFLYIFCCHFSRF